MKDFDLIYLEEKRFKIILLCLVLFLSSQYKNYFSIDYAENMNNAILSVR